MAPALIAFFGPGGAADAGDSAHDLAPGNQETCPACHFSPAATDPAPPPWNPNQNAGAYTMYRSTTMDMAVAGRPQGTSLVCLSCHDGTIAGDHAGGNPSLGTDLSSSHPISVTYDTSRDRHFANASGGRVGALPLYGDRNDQVECATCHDPHDNGLGSFLRMDNGGSALCLTCHRL